jgi:hypothetical protein
VGEQPRGGEVALLAQIGPQDPDVEVLRLDAAQPVIQRANRRVDRKCLVVVGRSPRRDWAGVGAILPEQRPYPSPVAPGEPLRIAAEQMLDAVLVAPTAGRSTVFDSTPAYRQDAKPEREITGAAQTDCRCASNWARSSWFSRRVPGVTSANAQRTIPFGSINTYARLEKNLSSSRVP